MQSWGCGCLANDHILYAYDAVNMESRGMLTPFVCKENRVFFSARRFEERKNNPTYQRPILRWGAGNILDMEAAALLSGSDELAISRKTTTDAKLGKSSMKRNREVPLQFGHEAVAIGHKNKPK